MKIKHIAQCLVISMVLIISLQGIKVYGDTEKKTIATVELEKKQMVKIKELMESIGATVKVGDKYMDITLPNGKILYIQEDIGVLVYDGTFIPYDIKPVGEFFWPDFFYPVKRDGDYLVPVWFLKKHLGFEINEKEVVVVVEKKPTATAPTTPNEPEKPVVAPPVTKPVAPPPTPQPVNPPVVTPPVVNPPSSTTFIGWDELKNRLVSRGWTNHNTYVEFKYNGSLNKSERGYAIALEQYSKAFDSELYYVFQQLFPSEYQKVYDFLHTTEIRSQMTIYADGHKVNFNVSASGVITISAFD